MQLDVVEDLSRLGPDEWNRLAGEQPFLRWEFLSALEQSGCVAPHAGWTPQHMTARAPDGRLVGAVPLYLKTHSYGEYVFDWSWANAYARAGRRYYPKLVAGVPFTPVTGARLLLAPDAPPETAERLLAHAHSLVKTHKASSLHWLFTTPEQTALIESHGALARTGCQFHWTNDGYRDFDDYLAAFSAQKRNKIKRERRYVQEAGVRMEVVSGADVATRHWDAFYTFYLSTIEKYGAIAYLNRAFFALLGERLARNVVLVLARADTRYVAGALNLRDGQALYGRYWGCLADYHSLHFEACYYTPIDYCIKAGLRRFEAGAQGEHKLARGFAPASTYSVHWLDHPEFRQLVAQAVARERQGVEAYMEDRRTHLPFKRAP